MTEFLTYHTPIFYLIQSVWRDEAFSYFMAKPDIIQVIINTANDFNPPLYYLLLHYWIIIFGKSDVLLRILSYIPHLLTAVIAYKFALVLFKKRKYAIFVMLFTFLNPMLLYYAFEMRMYSLYALFSICALYFFYRKNWKYYIIFSVLGLYTHSFFPLIIISFLFYLTVTGNLKKKNFIPTLIPLLFYIPWLPVIIKQFVNSNNSWLYPVDLQLIKSALGNIFTGFEGTPFHWWVITSSLSVIIFIFFSLSYLLNKKDKVLKNLALLLIISVFLPLFLILFYSVVNHPLYVNRYLIFITVYEILAISLAVLSIKNKLIRSLFAVFWIFLCIVINITLPIYHKKTDFKSTFTEINKSAKPQDFVYSYTPIGFLESAYYFRYPDHTYIYNPQNIIIPDYIGVNLVFPQASCSQFPKYPSKTYLVDDDASYQLILNNNQL